MLVHLSMQGDCLDRGMCAVGAGKGVVDVEIAQRGQRLRETGIVGLLAGFATDFILVGAGA